MGEAEVPGDHIERAAGEFGGRDGPVGGDPRGVRFVLPGERSSCGLVGAGSELVEGRDIVVRCGARDHAMEANGARLTY